MDRGLLVALVTDSFAVRAAVGSLLALAVGAWLLRDGRLGSAGARRLAAAAPLLVVAVAAAASVGAAWLPQVWTPDAAGSMVVELFGGVRLLGPGGLDLVVLCWAVVAATLLGRRVVGWLVLRRRLAAARPAPAALVEQVARAAARAGLTPPRTVLLDGCPGGAVATGLRAGRVAVDPALLARLDADEVAGLVAHEVAHLRSRDVAAGLAAGVVADLAWFVPGLRTARRRLAAEQERAADQAAARLTGRPGALASALLAVAEPGRTPALAAGCAAGGPAGGRGPATVVGRVDRLLAGHRRPGRRRRRVEAWAAAATVALVAATSVLVPEAAAERLRAHSVTVGWVAGAGEVREAGASEAMATFRALTGPAGPRAPHARGAAVGAREVEAGCLCLPGRAGHADPDRVVEREPAAGPVWGELDRRWAPDGVHGPQVASARPVVTVGEDRTAGVFVVGAPRGGR